LEDYNEKIAMNNKYAEVIGCSQEIIEHINKQILSRKELALLNPQAETNSRKPTAAISNPRLVKYAEQARKTSFTPIPPEFFCRSTSRSKSEL
jgi:hypothetical protein